MIGVDWGASAVNYIAAPLVVGLLVFAARQAWKAHKVQVAREEKIDNVAVAVLGKPADVATRTPGVPSLGEVVGSLQEGQASLREGQREISDALTAHNAEAAALVAESARDREDFRRTLTQHGTLLEEHDKTLRQHTSEIGELQRRDDG